MEVIDSLEIINAQTAVCTRCDERGYVAINRPIARGQGLKRIWLIGQAPGYSEGTNKIAFGGPAGKTLMRWFDQAGLSEEQVRSYFYISAINKCYPGRAKNGGGDRNPTPTERAICRPYLLRELALLKPKLLIVVGSTAIKETHGDKSRLEEYVGTTSLSTLGELYDQYTTRLSRSKEPAHSMPDNLKSWFDPTTPIEIHHLPHPSGASTWLNSTFNKDLLKQSLAILKERFEQI